MNSFEYEMALRFNKLDIEDYPGQHSRALWLARAERAEAEKEPFIAIKYTDALSGTKRRRDLDRIAFKWEKVERKCRAKAEEYYGD